MKEHTAVGAIFLETINTSEIYLSIKETIATGEVEKQESRKAEIGLGVY